MPPCCLFDTALHLAIVLSPLMTLTGCRSVAPFLTIKDVHYPYQIQVYLRAQTLCIITLSLLVRLMLELLTFTDLSARRPIVLCVLLVFLICFRATDSSLHGYH